MQILIHPMNETPAAAGNPAARLASLEGRAIGFLDISKPGGSVFLDRLELVLKERHHVGSVVRVMKPTFARPAPDAVIEQLRGVDAVVEALAD